MPRNYSSQVREKSDFDPAHILLKVRLVALVALSSIYFFLHMLVSLERFEMTPDHRRSRDGHNPIQQLPTRWTQILDPQEL